MNDTTTSSAADEVRALLTNLASNYALVSRRRCNDDRDSSNAADDVAAGGKGPYRQHDDANVSTDAYRIIRDVSNLLYEEGRVRDAFDDDPFDLMRNTNTTRGGDGGDDHDDGGDDDGAGEDVDGWEEKKTEEEEEEEEEEQEIFGFNDDNIDIEKRKNGRVIARVKGMMRVVSCHRIACPNGYSSVSAIVQFDDDGGMGPDVKRNVRLKFDFLREPNNDTNIPARSSSRRHRSTLGGDVDRAATERSNENDDYDDNNDDVKRHDANGGGEKKRRRVVDDRNGDEGIVAFAAMDGFGEGGGTGPNDGDASAAATASRGTTITYKIDYSFDYGEMKPLLGIGVYALGDHPSIVPPVPIIDDDAEESGDEDDCDVIDGRDNDEGTNKQITHDGRVSQKCTVGMKDNESDGVEMSEYDGGYLDREDVDVNGDGDGTEGDRFKVFVNPENVVGFLDRANINLDERSVFYFLLTFPFYEHEWDLAGFLFSALFDDDDDGESEDDDEEEEEYPDEEEDEGSSALDRYKKFLIGGYGKNYCSPCV